jgi:hypothetical protein
MNRKNPAAVALGRLGGIARAKALSPAEISSIAGKAGKARLTKITAARRSEIARLAVLARIKKYGQNKTKER